jgi:hypothetical protein
MQDAGIPTPFKAVLQRVRGGDDSRPERQGAPKVNVKVIGPKKVSSKSLLNPWDPDTTYSGHKGQGFHV